MDPRLIEVQQYVKTSAAVQVRTADACASQIVDAADVIAAALRANGKLLLCGNGGSAADCQHVAAEFTSGLRKDRRRRALPAIALTTDTSFLTAYGNDYDFAGVFARQVEALGQSGDVLIAISTSGRSENIRQAILAAQTRSLRTIGLFGEGGLLNSLVDVAIVIPSGDTQFIQEAMLPVEHLLCELTERALMALPAHATPR